jgi:hypothetical protein
MPDNPSSASLQPQTGNQHHDHVMCFLIENACKAWNTLGTLGQAMLRVSNTPRLQAVALIINQHQ